MIVARKIALFAALALVPIASTIAGEDVPPRYKLEVGQELTYDASSLFQYDNGNNSKGSHGSKNSWTFWVLKKNDDGSHRLLGRQSSLFVQSQARDEGTPTVSVAYFDLFDDGRIVSNSSFGFQFDPSSVFPTLPKDASAMAKGWESTSDDNRTSSSAVNDADPTMFVFESTRTSPMDKIYLMTHSSRVHFDRARGLVVKIELQNSQGYGFEGKGKGTTELKSSKVGDKARMAAIATESVAYFAAKEAYDKLTQESVTSPEVEATLKKAVESLKQAREALRDPIFRDQVDKDIAGHEAIASYYVQGAKERAAVMGKPAPGFEIKDLQGRTHTLDQYKGKVVLLDFWYRGCGWCIKAMPQVKEVVSDFQGQPVAVLGMNTDRDDKDSQFVVDAMGLNYPTLKATGIPEKFHVRAFPTLIIIDQDGKVADIHVGYSKTLREDVGKSVRKLLDRK